MSGMPWEDFAAPAAAPAASAPAAGGAPWEDFAAPAAAPQAAAPPAGIPGLAPGTQTVAPTNDMAARQARMKAAPPTIGQKIGGAVEAALNLATGMINYPIGVAAGVVGNVATAAGEGVGAVQTALDRRSRGVPQKLPGDPSIGDAGEHLLEGKYMRDTVYQPKTDVGQENVEDYVAPTMNALGPAIGHGHELVHAAPGVAPAARAAGDVVRPAARAAGEAAAKGAAKVIGVDPELAKVAQIAGDLKHPIDVRPDQVVKNAKFSKLAGQAAADVPLANSKTKSNQVNFTRNVINELNPEEVADRLTPETFSKAMDRSGGGIGEIMSRTDVPLDADLRSGTDALRKDVTAKGTDADAKIVNAYLDELHSKAGDDGVISGAALRELNSEIGLRARQNVGNDLGTRLNDLQGVIEDAVQKNVDPKDGAALKDFRRQYAYGKILEPTVAKTIDGVLPPSQLMGAVTRTTLGKHLMAMGKGGPMGDLAKVGQLIKEPGSSGTAERHLVYGAGLGGLGYVEPHTAAAAYTGALGYNTLGPKLTRAMVGKRPKKAAPPPAEPPAPPPEPTTSPGAGGPRGGDGGGGAPGPLGDLTPDWSTTPGAGGGAPRGGHEPGLVRAVDETPPTTGSRRGDRPSQPLVPGKPGIPDRVVVGAPAEAFLDEKTQAALNEPGAVEARKKLQMPETSPVLSETARLAAEHESPAVRKVLQDHEAKIKAAEKDAAAKVVREHDAQALERAARDTTDPALQARLLKQADVLRETEKIPVGKVVEGEPKGKPEPEPKPIPAGEATEITPEYIEADRAWRAEHKLGAEDAQRARDVAAALGHDEKAVHAAVRQFENQPRAFDREIARITEEGEARANESKLAAAGGNGDAQATGAPLREDGRGAPVREQQGDEPVPTEGSGAARVAEPEPAAAVRAGNEQPGADSVPKTGTGLVGEEAAGGRAPAGTEAVRGVERRKLTGGSIFERLAAEGVAQKKRLGDVDIQRAAEPPKAEIREVPGGFEAYRDGKKVGYLKDNLERGQAKQLGENANVSVVKVDAAEQGKGTGRALYAAFNDKHEGRIIPSGKTEPPAWKVWKRNYPDKVDAFVKQEAARIRDGADAKLVAGNITDPEVRARVLKESEDGKQLQSDAVQPKAGEKGLQGDAIPEANIDFSAEAQAEPFYSQLTRSVEALKQGKAGADQWAGILKNLKGVKPEEIEWSGVNDWLKAQDGSVTREALAQFLRDGGVKVQEVQKGGAGQMSPEMQRYVHEHFGDNPPVDAAGWTVEATRAEDSARAWQRNGYEAKARRLFQRAAEMEEIAERYETDSGNRFGTTKYSTYQLPGGSNYREVLLTLPPKKAPKLNIVPHPEREGFALQHENGEYVRSGPESVTPGTIKSWHSREFAEQYGRDAHDPSRQGNYTSPHWNEKNVLAHIRLNDRVDAEGRKVLFVEELQSDWAQKGKKVGFISSEKLLTPEEQTALRAESSKLGKEMRLRNAKYRADHPEAEQISDELLAQNRAAGDRIFEIEKQIDENRQKQLTQASNGTRVPDAPFVGNTSAWTALAIKRIAKLASDEGYDRVAFVNGEQSAARYDLSKHIDRIDYTKNGDGTYNISAIKDGAEVFSKEEMGAEDLADHIGKEAAQKIIDGEGKPSVEHDEVQRWEPEDDIYTSKDFDYEKTQPKSLSGLDLKVGGEGMKAFYDKIVPNVAKDVVKKLGGDGLTTSEMAPPQGKVVKTNPYVWQIQDGQRFRASDGTWPYDPTAAQEFRSADAAKAAIDPFVSRQVAFDITPQMRANAENGVPLFKQGEAAPAKQYLGTKDALDASLREKFGDKLVQGLLDQGVLKYAKNIDEQPEGVRRGVKAILRRPVEGQHAATLYFDKLTAEEAPGVLMHEIGEHFGIIRVLGQERYNVMLNDLRKMKDDPEVRTAWDHVKKNYIGSNSQKQFVTTEDPGFVREVAARLVETQPDLPFVRRLINEIRAFFYEKFGTTMANRVDANLIRGLAAAALRKASTGELPNMKGNVSPIYKPFVARAENRSSAP